MSTTINLVKGDVGTTHTFTFTGLDLSTYDTCRLLIRLNNHTRITKTLTPGNPAVAEGTVTWAAGDLDVVGTHSAEAEFVLGAVKFRVPQTEAIILNVRDNLGAVG